MSEEDNDKNIELWKSVESTDPKYMKNVNFGKFKFKSIDAQYQILQATKKWGSYGSGWGVKEETFTPIMVDTKVVCSIIYTAILYYPGGEFPINSDIGMYSKSKETYVENSDYIKKVSTDALTKGLSKLGFSADIFMGGYDGNKYDGIESFVPKDMMTAEQSKTLNGYIKDFEATLPDKSNWIKSEISKGLTLDQANLVIKKIKDFKSRGTK